MAAALDAGAVIMASTLAEIGRSYNVSGWTRAARSALLEQLADNRRIVAPNPE
jgi:hypothetical protein